MANASAGPDPVRAEQGLETPSLVVVGEAVEDDGVLADVGVDVRTTSDPGPPARPRGGRAPTPGSRRPRTSTTTSPSAGPRHQRAAERTDHRATPRSPPATARRSGSVVRWQTARARASATSGGRAPRPGRARWPPSAEPAPWSRPRNRRPPASPRWRCTATTSSRTSAAAASARPLAWPTDMAVRAFAWKNTRSTATADWAHFGHQRPQLLLEDQQSLGQRGAGRSR